jgi:hypothetical protein
VNEVRVALATTVLVLGVGAASPAALARAAARNPTPTQIRNAVSRAEHSKSLWATVNICDTRRDPKTFGVRGQMPALGFASWLTMVVRVDYYSTTKKRFLPTGAAIRVRLGRLSFGLQQDGATFGRFKPHAGLLDASIQFLWERSGKLLGQATRGTTAGHPDADFGSPPHFSASQCRIR